MKERPILFSGAMVRALLAGTKTQTRRTIKPQPGDHPTDEGHGVMHRCPYGKPGDRLWVRESIRFEPGFIEDATLRYQDGASKALGPNSGGIPDTGLVTYFRLFDKAKAKGKTIGVPSIHMPRWASRITLEITEVRVQRLQEISESDADAEGAHVDDGHVPEADANGVAFTCSRDAYRHLWESIHGAGSWAANPHVWAISFKRITP